MKGRLHGGESGDEGVPLRSGLVGGEEHGGAQELGEEDRGIARRTESVKYSEERDRSLNKGTI